jgi:hypothetical protein
LATLLGLGCIEWIKAFKVKKILFEFDLIAGHVCPKTISPFCQGCGGERETPTPRQNGSSAEMIAGENSKIHQANVLSDHQGDIS